MLLNCSGVREAEVVWVVLVSVCVIQTVLVVLASTLRLTF